MTCIIDLTWTERGKAIQISSELSNARLLQDTATPTTNRGFVYKYKAHVTYYYELCESVAKIWQPTSSRDLHRTWNRLRSHITRIIFIEGKNEYITQIVKFKLKFLMIVEMIFQCFWNFRYLNDLALKYEGDASVIKVALFGLGRAGTIHLASIRSSPRVKLLYIVDEMENKFPQIKKYWHLDGVTLLTSKQADRVFKDARYKYFLQIRLVFLDCKRIVASEFQKIAF